MEIIIIRASCASNKVSLTKVETCNLEETPPIFARNIGVYPDSNLTMDQQFCQAL